MIDIGGVLGPTLAERQLEDGTYSLKPGPKRNDRLSFLDLREEANFEIYIISRASSMGRIKANIAWLTHWFPEITLQKPGKVHIDIYDGPRSHKAELVRKYQIDVAVDDHYEVLTYMPPNVHLFACRPTPKEVMEYHNELTGRVVIHVESFAEFAACMFVGDN